MSSSKNIFWRSYKKNAVLAWVYLVATPVVPVALGIFNHFIFGGNFFITRLLELLTAIPFVLCFYYGLKYRLEVCPHCKQHPNNLKNFLFPFNPICKKCGKRMDVDSEAN